MQCKNCGGELPAETDRCYFCGLQLHRRRLTKEEKAIRQRMRNRQVRRAKVLLAAGVGALCLIVTALIYFYAFFSYATIDMKDCVTVQYSGYHSNGSITVTMNQDKIKKILDNAYSRYLVVPIHFQKHAQAEYESLYDSIECVADKTENLHNGDEITISFHYNEKLADKLKVECLAKEQKIVIYCYEDGSRGRKVLKEILKDRQVKALQSDGYNVYMYIDKELVDTEHLCCLAHARAKFVYAYEQGDDPDAKYLIDCFGELYRLEDTYKLSGLSAQEITSCRHSLRTKEIIGRIRSKLDVLLSPTHPPRGELMDKAVNYLQVFWKQLFAYLNDGRYDIDNSIAERFIRPLAGERKNSLFFVGSRMANVSAAYHTLLSTCRMNGLSALEYLKKFFHEIVKGRKIIIISPLA